MNPERLQQIEKFFHSALKREPSERAAFLTSECGGDESLRGAVESLLKHHEQAKSFIELPATVAAAAIFDDEKVGFLTGRSIGHYLVLELLGAGGMGEVYLAQDTSLGRQVALKLLPALYTQDADRLRRFEQEARTASALNHPNIVTIYEIGHADSNHFIATEYIEGATLRSHLATTRIKAVDALDIAVQVASALAAAHAKGVVHRDIKPENIMVLKQDYSLHRENYVKVLDFGIAKLTEVGSFDVEAPTKPLIKTNQGVVLGTVSYMSPEQARATVVDARTDIWSLGAVLYEMLAGKLPFAGETAEDVRASILRDTASLLSAEVPERLKWIVEKALRKDREDRYQTAREFFSDLRELQKQELSSDAPRERSVATQTSDVEPVSSGQSSIAPKATGSTREIAAAPTSSAEYIVGEIKRHKRGVAIAVAVLLLATAGIAYGLFGLWRRSQARPPVSSQSMKITRLTETGNATAATISPDGNYVAYAFEEQGKQSLRLRQVASTSEKEIVAPAEIRFMGLTFSRDNNLIYYTAAPKANPRGVLYQVPTLGGTPRKLLGNVFGPANLSPDGKSLAFTRTTETNQHTDELIVANADGTGERTLAIRKGQAYLNNAPSWSPDGKTIVCGAGIEPDYKFDSVLEVTVENGKERWITSHTWLNVFRTAWLPDGSALIVIARESVPGGSQIWLSYPGGEVRKITNDLSSYLTNESAFNDVSLGLTANSDTLVVVQEDTSSRIWVTRLGDDENRAHQITNGKWDGMGGVSWTPDRKILTVMRTGDEVDIWSMNPDGGERKQLTTDRFGKSRPAMTPDGRYVVFSSIRSGFFNLWRMDADGSNQKQLTNGRGGYFAPQFTPDGQSVIFWSYEWSGFPILGKVSIEGGEITQLTNYHTVSPVISPDATLIAAGHLNEKGDSIQLLLIPIEGGPPLKSINLPVGVSAGTGLDWMRDGKALAHVDTRNGVSNIWSLPIYGSPPKQLTNFKSDLIFRFALSPDGRQLVLARGTQTRDVVLIRDFR